MSHTQSGLWAYDPSGPAGHLPIVTTMGRM
jgi:hypothetical protein